MLRAWTSLKARYTLTDYMNVLISFAFNLRKYFEVVLIFDLFIKNMSCINLLIIALENCSEI